MLSARYVQTKKTKSLQEKLRGTSPRDLIFDLAQLPRHDAHQPLFHQQTIHLKQIEPQQVSWPVQYRRQNHLHPKPHVDLRLAPPDLRELLVVVQPQDHVNLIVATQPRRGGPALPR
jgi:hypothetical protein